MSGKLILSGFLSICLFLSCKNTKTNANTSAEPSRASERRLLIEELRKLKMVLSANDKQKVADIFQFPVAGDVLGGYIDDSLYNEQLKRNGDTITRDMFLNTYQKIYNNTQVDQLNRLFVTLKLDDLLQKDTLEKSIEVSNEPCYHYYKIGINKNVVQLSMGTNSNRNYENKSTDKEEAEENSSENCEHVRWWIFHFNDHKLVLKQISGAD